MQQPLVVEIWGKQADAEQAHEDSNNNNSKNGMSTKQLMNVESVSKVKTVNASTRDDDDKYKLMSELSSLRKRNNRLNSRMVIFLLIIHLSYILLPFTVADLEI